MREFKGWAIFGPETTYCPRTKETFKQCYLHTCGLTSDMAIAMFLSPGQTWQWALEQGYTCLEIVVQAVGQHKE